MASIKHTPSTTSTTTTFSTQQSHPVKHIAHPLNVALIVDLNAPNHTQDRGKNDKRPQGNTVSDRVVQMHQLLDLLYTLIVPDPKREQQHNKTVDIQSVTLYADQKTLRFVHDVLPYYACGGNSQNVKAFLSRCETQFLKKNKQNARVKKNSIKTLFVPDDIHTLNKWRERFYAVKDIESVKGFKVNSNYREREWSHYNQVMVWTYNPKQFDRKYPFLDIPAEKVVFVHDNAHYWVLRQRDNYFTPRNSINLYPLYEDCKTHLTLESNNSGDGDDNDNDLSKTYCFRRDPYGYPLEHNKSFQTLHYVPHCNIPQHSAQKEDVKQFVFVVGEGIRKQYQILLQSIEYIHKTWPGSHIYLIENPIRPEWMYEEDIRAFEGFLIDMDGDLDPKEILLDLNGDSSSSSLSSFSKSKKSVVVPLFHQQIQTASSSTLDLFWKWIHMWERCTCCILLDETLGMRDFVLSALLSYDVPVLMPRERISQFTQSNQVFNPNEYTQDANILRLFFLKNFSDGIDLCAINTGAWRRKFIALEDRALDRFLLETTLYGSHQNRHHVGIPIGVPKQDTEWLRRVLDTSETYPDLYRHGKNTICLALHIRDENEQQDVLMTLKSAFPYITHWVICDAKQNKISSLSWVESFFENKASQTGKRVCGHYYYTRWESITHNHSLALCLAHQSGADYILNLKAGETIHPSQAITITSTPITYYDTLMSDNDEIKVDTALPQLSYDQYATQTLHGNARDTSFLKTLDVHLVKTHREWLFKGHTHGHPYPLNPTEPVRSNILSDVVIVRVKHDDIESGVVKIDIEHDRIKRKKRLEKFQRDVYEIEREITSERRQPGFLYSQHYAHCVFLLAKLYKDNGRPFEAVRYFSRYNTLMSKTRFQNNEYACLGRIFYAQSLSDVLHTFSAQETVNSIAGGTHTMISDMEAIFQFSEAQYKSNDSDYSRQSLYQKLFYFVANAYQEAYSRAPHRVEALYSLARLCLEFEHYHLAGMFVKTAIQIPNPGLKSIWVDDDLYACKLWYLGAQSCASIGEDRFALTLYKRVLTHPRCKTLFSEKEQNEMQYFIIEHESAKKERNTSST